MSKSSFEGFPSPKPDKKGGINPFKSIQQGIAAFGASTTANVTLPIAVDIANSVVIVYPLGDVNINTGCAKASLTSSTNILFTTFAASSAQFGWQVIEFRNLKSFQSGNFSAVSTVVTINAVVLAKSMLFFNYKSTTNSLNATDAFMGGYLSSPTAITFNNSGTSKDVNWYVVEFY